ncbi:MAG TPA: aminodeoxychorismate/anthranilate synthase component II [Ignavibacteriaceae bacterium]
MKILVIDNYDSFTYNLVQMIGMSGCKLAVKRNDEINLSEINELKPDKILISPGPGKPEQSKISLDIIKHLGNKLPILGVCLGHQAIGICYGGKVINAKQLMHGKVSKIIHNEKSIFKNIPQSFYATRYHSLIIEKESLPDELDITASTEDGTIMGVRHKKFPVEGIQFHPESILTSEGNKIINNWLNL